MSNVVMGAAVSDRYAAFARYTETHRFNIATRYKTIAFLRLKLDNGLAHRRVAPHMLVTADEAHSLVEETDA